MKRAGIIPPRVHYYLFYDRYYEIIWFDMLIYFMNDETLTMMEFLINANDLIQLVFD